MRAVNPRKHPRRLLGVYVRADTTKDCRGNGMPQQLTDARALQEFASRIVWDNSQEQSITIFLNDENHVVSYCVSALETANCSPVRPRELAQHAVATGASYVIVAHYLPKGGSKLSEEQRNVAARIVRNRKLRTTTLIEYAIFSEDSYESFESTGWY